MLHMGGGDPSLFLIALLFCSIRRKPEVMQTNVQADFGLLLLT